MIKCPGCKLEIELPEDRHIWMELGEDRLLRRIIELSKEKCHCGNRSTGYIGLTGTDQRPICKKCLYAYEVKDGV